MKILRFLHYKYFESEYVHFNLKNFFKIILSKLNHSFVENFVSERTDQIKFLKNISKDLKFNRTHFKIISYTFKK